MDLHSQSRSLVLAARRPLSYAELSAAVDSTSSEEILGDVLEISGGQRPIVHFKEMTALGGAALDHQVAARYCLRILNLMHLGLDDNAFHRYAIEFVMKHAESAGESTHADFLRDFDYVRWQRWAVQMPVYAALNTYRFGAAMIRSKCFNLRLYVERHQPQRLNEGIPGSRWDDPGLWIGPNAPQLQSLWREDVESRLRRRLQQRELPLDIEPLVRTRWDDTRPRSSSLPELSHGWSTDVLSRPIGRAVSPSSSVFVTDLTPPSEAGWSDFEMVTPPSEAGLSDFEMLEMDDEVLRMEDLEYQEAILASLQQGREGVGGQTEEQ